MDRYPKVMKPVLKVFPFKIDSLTAAIWGIYMLNNWHLGIGENNGEHFFSIWTEGSFGGYKSLDQWFRDFFQTPWIVGPPSHKPPISFPYFKWFNWVVSNWVKKSGILLPLPATTIGAPGCHDRYDECPAVSMKLVQFWFSNPPQLISLIAN